MLPMLKQGFLNCLTLLVMIPCYCCMLVGFLAALPLGYDDGREAASAILDFQFDEEVKEIEFVDSPPIAIFPGGASEWLTWVVLELGEAQAIDFEQTVSVSPKWQKMPLPQNLREHGLQPPSPLEGIEIKERLPTENTHGYYMFNGDLQGGSFVIAVYDPKTRRVYVNVMDQ